MVSDLQTKKIIKNKLLNRVCNNCYYFESKYYGTPNVCASLAYLRMYALVRDINDQRYNEFKINGIKKEENDTCHIWMEKE